MRTGLFQFDSGGGGGGTYFAGAGLILVGGDTFEIDTNGVTNAMLRQSGALSVIGRAANSTGDVADISAGSNDTLLRRTSDTLNWGGVTNGMLTANSIGLDKLVNAAAQYNVVGRKTSGAGAWEDATRLELNIPGLEQNNTFTGDNTINAATLDITRYANVAAGFLLRSNKARGTSSVPLTIVQNDFERHSFRFYDGSTFRTAGQVDFTVTAATPSSTDMQSRWNVAVCAAASISATDVIAADHVTGLQAFGTNVFLDTNRIFRPRSYTTGTLPAAPATGIIHCSDLGGGGALLMSNGSAWIRVKASGTSEVTTDAGHTFTWTRLTRSPVTIGDATLTATRTVTLSTTGCQNGDRAWFYRQGGGAFNWAIAGATTHNLAAAGDWCVFEFDGAAWNLIANSAVSNTPYGTSWNGVTAVAPSQDAVYDKFEGYFLPITPVSGNYVVLNQDATVVADSGSGSADVLYGGLFRVLRRITITELGFNVRTTAAGNAQVAIYANVSGLPGTAPLVATGNLSCASAGPVAEVLGAPIVLEPGAYWFFINRSVTAAFLGASLSGVNGLATNLGNATATNILSGSAISAAPHITAARTFGSWGDISGLGYTYSLGASRGPILLGKIQ